MASHCEDEQRNRQGRADNKAAAEVDVFLAWTFGKIDPFWLKRHAADRTTAGADLFDFRVHRTSENIIIGGSGLRFEIGVKKDCWARFELGLASGRAEIECCVFVLSGVLGGSDRHAHSANGIGCRPVRRLCVFFHVICKHDISFRQSHISIQAYTPMGYIPIGFSFL